ncbi:hypothetical protein [Marinicella gelatinilytica]|uniref:hypothetical protein n=1 Tax=Marinicella gelatinilytica TaxID=2996017 RepID=UPI002260B913|nr:hypothetical protein [Marinicella gelatinilytica]MCX7545142.1 hypothetical protein [Marinicella gelatinilytica]
MMIQKPHGKFNRRKAMKIKAVIITNQRRDSGINYANDKTLKETPKRNANQTKNQLQTKQLG